LAIKLKEINSQEYLVVAPEATSLLSEQAFGNIARILQLSHLQQLGNILDELKASEKDE
jgi:hypothetical protein